jgi:Tfp pilus assembly protein PilV
MVEFLMAAFILAIGLLGLATLQILALRSAGTSRGMTTSVLVADGITERIATEADQSYLGMIFSSAPTGKTRYLGKAPVQAGVNPTAPVPDNAIVDYFDAAGTPLQTATGAFFTAFTWIDNQTPGNGSTGQTDVFRVRVVFNEAPNPANPGTFLTHAVNVTRTVIHA